MFFFSSHPPLHCFFRWGCDRGFSIAQHSSVDIVANFLLSLPFKSWEMTKLAFRLRTFLHGLGFQLNHRGDRCAQQKCAIGIRDILQYSHCAYLYRQPRRLQVHSTDNLVPPVLSLGDFAWRVVYQYIIRTGKSHVSFRHCANDPTLCPCGILFETTREERFWTKHACYRMEICWIMTSLSAAPELFMFRAGIDSCGNCGYKRYAWNKHIFSISTCPKILLGWFIFFREGTDATRRRLAPYVEKSLTTRAVIFTTGS